MKTWVFFGVNERRLIDVGTVRKRRAFFECFSMLIEELGNAVILAGANKHIDFRHLVFELLRVALRQAAAGHEHFAFSVFLLLSHLKNRLDRLFFRSLNEGAGVDDDDFCVFWGLSDRVAIIFQHAQHDLRIDQVFRAAEADEVNRRLFTFRGRCHEWVGHWGFRRRRMRMGTAHEVMLSWVLS